MLYSMLLPINCQETGLKTFLYLAFFEYYHVTSWNTLLKMTLGRWKLSEVHRLDTFCCFLLDTSCATLKANIKQNKKTKTFHLLSKTLGQVPICYKQVEVMMTHCAKHLFCKYFPFLFYESQASRDLYWHLVASATITSGRVSCLYTPARVNVRLLFRTSLMLWTNPFKFVFILLLYFLKDLIRLETLNNPEGFTVKTLIMDKAAPSKLTHSSGRSASSCMFPPMWVWNRPKRFQFTHTFFSHSSQ